MCRATDINEQGTPGLGDELVVKLKDAAVPGVGIGAWAGFNCGCSPSSLLILRQRLPVLHIGERFGHLVGVDG